MNDCFDKIYTDAVKNLRKIFIRKNETEDPENFINEAYLYLIESNKPITINGLVEKAAKLALKEHFRERKTASKEKIQTCPKCRESMPIGMFYSTNLRRPYCKDCIKKYFKDYFKNNSVIWNLYMKTRYRNDAEKLSDAYIKKYLRCYGHKTENITPLMIYQKRQEIMNRKQKNGSILQ